MKKLAQRFPHTCRLLGDEHLAMLTCDTDQESGPWPEPRLFGVASSDAYPEPFFGDLSAVESAYDAVRQRTHDLRPPEHGAVINPLLDLVAVRYDVTPFFMEEPHDAITDIPVIEQEGWIVVWKGPVSGRIYVEYADQQMLLVLKLLADGEDALALKGKELLTYLDALDHAARKGIVLKAHSLIARDVERSSDDKALSGRFLKASVFTLQWHLTNRCDLHCRHCYDRDQLSPLRLDHARAVLDDFASFCHEKNVRGHICFSGGNPFLYPHFFALYAEAVDRGFATSVLGNVVSGAELERLTALIKPDFYQVSLEGLEPHNDFMRGEGYYRRVLAFLDLLREHGIYSVVMLTLTGSNIDQVIPLAREVSGRADYFTFNRLAQVGEGSDLSLPDKDRYREFLATYLDLADSTPGIGIKDNLFNILRKERDEPYNGGCTGFGCGAAFNFFALLPDGSVHACRKFPSPVGVVPQSRLSELYDSMAAKRYRRGPESCQDCSLAPVCKGCMAVVHGMGLDVFHDRDPFCFFRSEGRGTT